MHEYLILYCLFFYEKLSWNIENIIVEKNIFIYNYFYSLSIMSIIDHVWSRINTDIEQYLKYLEKYLLLITLSHLLHY